MDINIHVIFGIDSEFSKILTNLLPVSLNSYYRHDDGKASAAPEASKQEPSPATPDAPAPVTALGDSVAESPSTPSTPDAPAPATALGDSVAESPSAPSTPDAPGPVTALGDSVAESPSPESPRPEMSIGDWKAVLADTQQRLQLNDGGANFDKKRAFVALVRKIAKYYGADKPASLTPANLFYCARQVVGITIEGDEFRAPEPEITPEQVLEYTNAPY